MQKLVSSKTNREYVFDDTWDSMKDYLSYMEKRLIQCRRVLTDTGSIFVHCDRNASHYLKVLMDEIFGISNFQSEIIWSYKRWSNSKKGLLNNHQIILFYSKTLTLSLTGFIQSIQQLPILIRYCRSVYEIKMEKPFINTIQTVILSLGKVKREFRYLMYGRFHI